MPWQEVSPMNERRRFISDYHRGLFPLTELCQQFGISRKTAYKWIERFEADGNKGLGDRSRRPHGCPHETPADVAEALIEARRRHPSWGAKKLLRILSKRHPRWPWPARSTACDILKRHGLIKQVRRRRRPGHPGRPQTPMSSPNEIWTADFKGHFLTRDGLYCYPLTVADGFTRYLLACQALLSPSHQGSRRVFRHLFQEYGLPQIIRTDNGSPFASTALGRLSRLSVWWIRLGIFPELIEPAHPEQNGRHERMHRTLKAEATRPPSATSCAQQRRFNRFRREFNADRPHEALGQRTPASIYQSSPRPFPPRVPEIEYPAHFEVRRVSRNGGIRWRSNWVNVSSVLGEEFVGLEEIDNDLWNVYFGPLNLGRMNERNLKIEDALGRKRRKKLSPMSPD
jgi:putative transposase